LLFISINYTCNVIFAAVNREISLDSVWPAFGPVAGGTRVTITGSSLNVSAIAGVYFGQYKGSLTRLFSTLIFMILVDIIFL